MNPRLVAIAGPAAGSMFPLDGGELSLGRDPSNGIPLDDPSTSRRHCVIRHEGGAVHIRDLGSSNGTFVNGVPITERLLSPGDEIRVGTSVFQFVTGEENDAPRSGEVELTNSRVETGGTLRLETKDATYLQPQCHRQAPAPEARIARDLGALLKISTTVGAIHDPEILQRQLLDLVFDVVPAERGAILLFNELGELASVSAFKPGSAGRGPFRVSQTITQEVLRDATAILANDILQTPERASESLAVQRIASLMAVPLAVFGRNIGVIYLDTLKAGVRFEADDLQLVTAVAAVAAVALESARRFQSLEGEKRKLVDDLDVRHRMVGESQAMADVFKVVAKAAATDATVLIRGESGTGKELVARALHKNSGRSSKPFVALNCAALPETLLESELFGYEKGAFTGAAALKKGKLETAEGGTVFLDEIGEIPLHIQTKLLRVLQEREIDRVGGVRPIKVNLRLVAATNRNLEDAIKAGTFRQDLFYRLNVIRVLVPSLRDRRNDIPLLASYFLARHSEKCGRRVFGISPEARACLLVYDWPGNVRELENAIERAVVLGGSDRILPEDLPEEIVATAAPSEGASLGYLVAVQAAKRQIVLNALEEADGSHTKAAQLLGVHPGNLHRLMKTLGLKGTPQN